MRAYDNMRARQLTSGRSRATLPAAMALTPRTRGLALTALAASLWGLWPLFLRPAGVPGTASAAIAAILIAVCGLPAQWRGRRRRRSVRGWLWMGLAGLLDAGNMGCYFTALARGSIAAAVLSHYLAPVLAPPLSRLLIGERISPRTPVAAGAGLAGLLLVLWPAPGGGPVLTAALFGAASALFYGALFPAGRRLTREFDPWEVQSYHAYVTAAALLVLAPPPPISVHSLGLVVAGSLLCAVFAGLLFYRGLALAPAGQVAVLTYLEPLGATALGAAIFHEPVGPWAALGALLVVGGGAYLALERPPLSSAAA